MDVAADPASLCSTGPAAWLVTAADGGRRGGFIATTVAQARSSVRCRDSSSRSTSGTTRTR